MKLPESFSLLLSSIHSIHKFENKLSERRNVLAFLVVRFVLMSGLIVGFSWASMSFQP